MKTVTLKIGLTSVVVSGSLLVGYLVNQNVLGSFSLIDSAIASVLDTSDISTACPETLANSESELIAEINSMSKSSSNKELASMPNNNQVLRLHYVFECYIALITPATSIHTEERLASQERVQNSIGRLFESNELQPFSSPEAYLVDYYSQVLTELSIKNSLIS